MNFLTPILTLITTLLLSQLATADIQHLETALTSADREIALAAVSTCAEQGATALPQLRTWAKSTDPRLRVRAQMGIGRITGQWASQTDLIWQRSFEAAKNQGKPILLLHLFGKLDEEFC